MKTSSQKATPAESYLEKAKGLIDVVGTQLQEIQQTAKWFSETTFRRMVHLFGSGHSRILVEEMWPRYGSFLRFQPYC